VETAAAREDLPVAVDRPQPFGRDRNPPGTTLHPEAVFIDERPPRGWEQCAGFVNTAQDDVTPDFFGGCNGARRLRVRVYDSSGRIEDDVFVSGVELVDEWPTGYLGSGGTVVKNTFWGTLDGGAQSVFFTARNGRDACMQVVAPNGMTLGSGHAEKAIIAPGGTGYDEYRLSCGRENLPDRRIALFR
jgi:hypothetical protein